MNYVFFKMLMNSDKGHMKFNSSKMGKSKTSSDKISVGNGLYENLRMMYATASLIGCVVQIQVQSGAVFEGVLRTFSQQFDVVLEMAHKVKPETPPAKGVSLAVQNLISSFPFEGGIYEKLVFRLADIILVQACNVDTDFAAKDNFTDKAISKFDGYIKERELEPYVWEGDDNDAENPSFIIEDESNANGWDPNDMFRTNAEKYGIKSSYDHNLPEYTVPLIKKDTEDYKLKEAKASQIAYEIEASASYQTQITLENGDEEDKYSAVIRPTNKSPPTKYIFPSKHCNLPASKKHPASPTYIPSCMPYTSYDLPAERIHSSHFALNASSSSNDGIVNMTKETYASVLPPLSNETVPVLSALPEMTLSAHDLRSVPEKNRNQDSDNSPTSKGEIVELRRHDAPFKMTKENKDFNDIEDVEEDSASLIDSVEQLKLIDEKIANVAKYSTLNPNAKEFVFNPNAKSFVPRPDPTLNTPSQNSLMHNAQNQMPVFTGVTPQYMVQPAAVSAPFMAPSIPQTTRFHKTLSSPPPLQMQYSSSGIVHTTPLHQQAAPYSQMNFVVGSPVVNPQTSGLALSEHSLPYCETAPISTHVMMPAHPNIHFPVAPAHTLQQQPHQSQNPILHSPSPASHSHQPTPPSLIYNFGQPPLHEASMAGVLHSGNHPVSSGTHPVMMVQQSPTSLHPIHLHHQQGHPVGTVGVHFMPHMSNVTTVKTIPMTTPSYVQNP